MNKISLIIPVYNSEKFLKKLLDSILEQTYNEYEVILINDGSTDNSINIINEYKKRDKRIKCITINNSGPGIARKTGFENSTGELLFFIDSDDFLPRKDILKEIEQIYRENQFDILIFNFIRKLKNKEYIVNAFFKNDIIVGLKNTEEFKKSVLAGALWCKIFKREKMEIEDFCDSNNYEDYYTTYKYINKCKNFYYTDKIFYYANRDNNDSISKKTDSRKIYDTVDLLEKTYNETKYKEIFSKIILEYYINARRMIDKIKIHKKEKRKCIEKMQELKEYFNLKQIIKYKLPIKQYIKYIYYELVDIFVI